MFCRCGASGVTCTSIGARWYLASALGATVTNHVDPFRRLYSALWTRSRPAGAYGGPAGGRRSGPDGIRQGCSGPAELPRRSADIDLALPHRRQCCVRLATQPIVARSQADGPAARCSGCGRGGPSGADVDRQASQEKELARKDMRACLRGEIGKLPEGQGSVLMLSELGGLTEDKPLDGWRLNTSDIVMLSVGRPIASSDPRRSRPPLVRHAGCGGPGRGWKRARSRIGPPESRSEWGRGPRLLRPAPRTRTVSTGKYRP